MGPRLRAVAIGSLLLLAGAAPARAETTVRVLDRPLADVAREQAAHFSGTAAEVPRELDALVSALRRWYASLPAAQRLAKDFAFPASTRWTPAHRLCRTRQRAYAPSDRGWSHRTWRSLGFRPSAPHHLRYRLISFGRGPEASFSLQARADPDCKDRKWLYRLSGHARDGRLHTLLLRIRRPQKP